FTSPGAQLGKSIRAQGARSNAIDPRHFCTTGAQPGRPIANRARAVAISFAASHSDVASPVAPDWRDRDTRPGGNAVGTRPPTRTGTNGAPRARAGIGAENASHSATGTKTPSVAGRCSSRLYERGE